MMSVDFLYIHSTNSTKTKMYTHIPTHTVNVLNVIAHYIHTNTPKNKVAGCVNLTAQRIKAPSESPRDLCCRCRGFTTVRRLISPA